MQPTMNGRGVFAAQNIRKGQFICKYEGKMCTLSELRKRQNQLSNYILEFKFNEKWWAVDATDENGTFGRLINHSKQNKNVKPIVLNEKGNPEVHFVAMKAIDKNEELLYDYGDNSKTSALHFPWLKK